MASCVSDGSGAGTTTTAGGALTSYVTIASTTTIPGPSTTAGLQPEHEYIVEVDDLPVTIASKFNVPLESLIELNEWEFDGQFVTNFPPVGTPIRIPAGGTIVGETLPPPPTAAPTAPATTTTFVQGCTIGEYTIEDGDYPIKVAQKFDTTLDALTAANEDTPGFGAFAVGVVIKIPAKTTGC